MGGVMRKPILPVVFDKLTFLILLEIPADFQEDKTEWYFG
jgi:hypothetical protein